MVSARKPDWTWRICYNYSSLNAITRPAVEPLPHIDARLTGRWCRASSRSSIWVPATTTSGCCLPIGRRQAFGRSWDSHLNVVPFGLQGSSSLLMALTVGLDFTGDSARPVPTTSATQLPAELPPIYGGVPGPGEWGLWAGARWSTWTII